MKNTGEMEKVKRDETRFNSREFEVLIYSFRYMVMRAGLRLLSSIRCNYCSNVLAELCRLKAMGSSEAKRIIRNAITSVFGIAVANWVVNYIFGIFISRKSFC